MGGLFSKPKPPKPTPPPVIKPPAALPDEPKLAKNRKKQAEATRVRGGRRSTILSENETLG